ncbi:MAG: NADH-quinone oxidoreductase subunit N [Candidatus Micrarchaeia archaeon]
MITIFLGISLAAALYIISSIIANIIKSKKIGFAFSNAFLVILFFLFMLTITNNYFGLHLDSMLSMNSFSVFMALTVTLGMILIHFIAYGEEHYLEFSLFSGFSFFGMLLVIMSTNIIVLFLGLEALAIPMVMMLLLSNKWLEAGIKYFVVVIVSAGLFAFGAAVLFIFGGNLQIINHNNIGDTIAMLFFVVSLGIESGLFPFNLWIPDVYQGGPSFVTAMLGGINKKVGIVALIYILLIVFPYMSQNLLLFFAVLTMIYGNLAALPQKNVKRMLAYSSISQVGYILIGLATISRYGLAASIFQIFAHMFAFIGVFAIVGALESKERTEIKDYIGLNNENKIMAFALSLFLFSMMGVPFTIGFVGKFMLFSSAVYSNFVWLAVLGIIATLISVYYYAKVIIAVYTNKANARHVNMRLSLYFVIFVSMIIVVLFGVFPSAIISLAQAAAQNII